MVSAGQGGSLAPYTQAPAELFGASWTGLPQNQVSHCSTGTGQGR